MMKMNLLAFVTPSSIYHGFSARKTFWKENFTGEEKLFSAVNMKNCGRRNVRKHTEITGSDKYVTLDISLNFYSREKMKIKYPESKGKLEHWLQKINCGCRNVKKNKEIKGSDKYVTLDI